VQKEDFLSAKIDSKLCPLRNNLFPKPPKKVAADLLKIGINPPLFHFEGLGFKRIHYDKLKDIFGNGKS